MGGKCRVKAAKAQEKLSCLWHDFLKYFLHALSFSDRLFWFFFTLQLKLPTSFSMQCESLAVTTLPPSNATSSWCQRRSRRNVSAIRQHLHTAGCWATVTSNQNCSVVYLCGTVPSPSAKIRPSPSLSGGFVYELPPFRYSDDQNMNHIGSLI